MMYAELVSGGSSIITKRRLLSIVLFCMCVVSAFSQKNFVTTHKHQLWLNGEPYYFTGTNYWYGPLLGMDKNNTAALQRLRNELDFLQKNGVTNLRVMAAVEGYGLVNGVSRVQPALQTAPGVFNDSLLRGLDFLLAEMGRRNMKAVLFLSNNWEWTGGFLQYVNWFGLVPDSIVQRKLNWDEQRDITSRFYSCEPCKDAYLQQVIYIINRTNTITGKPYINDPAIMAWQLANEPRPMRPSADAAYARWISDVAGIIKKFDKNHLVSIGHEGHMATDGDMALYEKIHACKNVDYLTIHIWAKNWGWFQPEQMQEFIDTVKERAAQYIAVHEAVAKKIGKPLVIEEFGLPRDHHQYSPATTTILRDEFYEVVLGAYHNSKLNRGNVAGVNFWAFGGMGRPLKAQVFWKKGDDYTGDPPMEEQGLNTVFDSDASTWELIRKYK